MKYKIIIEKQALRFIRKQNEAKQKLIMKAIHQLPFEGDIKTMQGMKGYFRLRVGEYRILYTVDHGELIVFVVDAGNRGDVYK